jgi:hypothetical protein
MTHLKIARVYFRTHILTLAAVLSCCCCVCVCVCVLSDQHFVRKNVWQPGYVIQFNHRTKECHRHLIRRSARK